MGYPNKQYDSFELEDFLKDDDFVLWAKGSKAERVQYWHLIMDGMPEKAATIDLARNMVLSLSHPVVTNTEAIKRRVWENIHQKYIATEKSADNQHKLQKTATRLWLRIIAYSAVASMLIFAVLFWNWKGSHIQKHPKTVLTNSDIRPGQLGATLTLSNGQSIQLSSKNNGQIATQGNISILKNAQGEIYYQANGKQSQAPELINTLSTANGQTFMLELPDKTKIWLNNASSISYTPSLLQQGDRVVHLVGEAYFEVAKDKNHPFIVMTQGQKVKVLGTHFVVKAYRNETKAMTTLLEGSVQLSSANQVVLLKPGQQGVNNGQEIQVSAVNVEEFVAWKKGDFNFNHVSFKTAMREIARWYDVEIIYVTNISSNIESGGWVSRQRPLSDVLRSIELSGLAKFEVHGKKVYVSQ